LEAVITASGLAWTIARPPRLVAGSETTYRATPDALPGMRSTFRAVAAFMLDAVDRGQHVAEFVGVSR